MNLFFSPFWHPPFVPLTTTALFIVWSPYKKKTHTHKWTMFRSQELPTFAFKHKKEQKKNPLTFSSVFFPWPIFFFPTKCSRGFDNPQSACVRRCTVGRLHVQLLFFFLTASFARSNFICSSNLLLSAHPEKTLSKLTPRTRKP